MPNTSRKDAELSLIGCIILEPTIINRIYDEVDLDWFTTKCKRIYELILELYENGRPIGFESISHKLNERKAGTEIFSLFIEAASKVPSATQYPVFIDIIKSSYIKDQLTKATARTLNSIQDGEDSDIVMNKMMVEIYRLEMLSSDKKFKSLEQIGDEAIKRYELITKRKEVTGIKTYYPSIDRLIVSLNIDELVIIAGRPSMGKTAFALNIARNNTRQGIPIAFFSLEMADHQIIDRFVVMETDISSYNLRTGNLTERELGRVGEVVSSFKKEPLYIIDKPNLTVFDIRSLARKYVDARGVKAIIVDYLQLIDTSGLRSGSRSEELGFISRNLKILSKELNIPVIALSQLNRAVESREDKRPMLSDLRESGRLEEDADKVMFPFRPGFYKKNSEDKTVECIFAKNRNGAIGTCNLRFEANRQTFFDDSKTIDSMYSPW